MFLYRRYHLYGLIIPLPYIMLQQKQKDRETFREVSNTFFMKTIPQPYFKHYLCISKYKLIITDSTIVEYPSLLLGHSFHGSIIPFIVIGNLKSSIYLLSLSWESELQQYQHLISLQDHVSDPFVQVRFTLCQQIQHKIY